MLSIPSNTRRTNRCPHSLPLLASEYLLPILKILLVRLLFVLVSLLLFKNFLLLLRENIQEVKLVDGPHCYSKEQNGEQVLWEVPDQREMGKKLVAFVHVEKVEYGEEPKG